MILFAALLLYVGNHQLGEIEIVTEPSHISTVVETQKQRLMKKGLSEHEAIESSRVGIIAEDIYWIWQRDPVLFPTGASGTYNRLNWKGAGGVAILPILPDGRVVLNLNFRHATRSWEWELPRGSTKAGEGSEEAARRELQEETGLEVSTMTFLGTTAPDSGVLGSLIPVYAGWVSGSTDANIEESEAIAGTKAFTIEEIETGLQQGYIEIAPQGKVPIRDSFLTFALYQAKIRQIH